MPQLVCRQLLVGFVGGVVLFASTLGVFDVKAVSAIADQRHSEADSSLNETDGDVLDQIRSELSDGKPTNIAERLTGGSFAGARLSNFLLDVFSATDSIVLENVRVDGALDLEGIEARDLSIEDSVISGQLDISGASISRDVDFSASAIRGGLLLRETDVGRSFVATELAAPWVDATGAQIGRSATLVQARIDGPVILAESLIGGNLEVEGLDAAALHLESARIGQSMDGIGVTLESILSGSNLTVEGDVWLDGLEATSLDLRWAKLGSSLNANQASLTSSIILNQAEIGGSLGLVESESEKIDLNYSSLDTVVMDRARVTGRFSAVSADVDTDLRLGVDARLTEVDLSQIHIERELRVWGSTITGDLLLRGSRAAGSLALLGPDGQSVTWGPTSSMDLRLAQFGSIDDSRNSWPSVILVEGYRFDTPRSKHESTQASDFVDRDYRWLIEWLERDSEGNSFPQQAYIEMEDSLRSAGRLAAADEVAIARLDRLRAESRGPRAVVSWIDWLLIGYGYRPWRAGVLVALLWAVGSWCAHKESAHTTEIDNPLMFSLDRLVPLVTFSRRYSDIEISNMKPVHRLYFYFHVGSGYLVGVLLAVTVARLTQV